MWGMEGGEEGRGGAFGEVFFFFCVEALDVHLTLETTDQQTNDMITCMNILSRLATMLQDLAPAPLTLEPKQLAYL